MEPDGRYYKKVVWPIAVAAGRKCWGRDDDEPGLYRCCGHFDNEFGPRCRLGVGEPKADERGEVPKPKECLALVDEKELGQALALAAVGRRVTDDLNRDRPKWWLGLAAALKKRWGI